MIRCISMSESLDKATPLELDMLILQKKISQGDFENIELFSEDRDCSLGS